MPRKPGVSNDLAAAPISNSGRFAARGLRPGAASSPRWPASLSLRVSPRTGPLIEQQFDLCKHVFDHGPCFLAEPDSKERIKMLCWGIVEVSTHLCARRRWRHG